MATNNSSTATMLNGAAGERAQLEHDIAQAVPTAFILLDALDRRTLAGCTPALTTAQYHALAALAQVPRQSLGQLANRLLCDKANVSKIMDRLEAMGLASRSPDEQDARRVVLQLTPKGRSALDSARSARAESLQRAFAPMQDDSVSQIGRSLVTLVARLRTALDHVESHDEQTLREAAE